MPKKKTPIIKPQIPIPVEKFINGGQGLGTLQSGVHVGQKGFFWRAIPGESIVEYRIIEHKSNYVNAVANKIQNPSPHRIAPKDPCYLATSPWQIIDYDYELQSKHTILENTFQRQHLLAPQPDGTLQTASEVSVAPVRTDGRDFFYRNKMEYCLYWDNELNQINLAFHQRASHRKVPITQSSLEHPAIFQYAQSIVDELNSFHANARDYQSLLLRANQQGQVSGGLYENFKPHPTFPLLTDTILGHTYSYSPNGFFQINLPVYEMALTEIQRHITTDNVLDLYAGVGTIGLSVARDRSLTLVEVNQAAFAEMEKNCATVSTAHAVLAKSEEVLGYIQPDQTVIVDPPRAGCAPQLIEQLLSVTPQSVIYLSCNIATQARDLQALLPRYHITHIIPFNFFPRTPHLENLVILQAKGGH